MKKDKLIPKREMIAEVFPKSFDVCIVSNPAKKKSPKPKDKNAIFPLIYIGGIIGIEIRIGNRRAETLRAAETIDPVNNTKITSIIVSNPTKTRVVFQENKLLTYTIIRIAKILP